MLIKEGTSRKIQIESEATLMFRDRGYAASSMRDLAATMGIEAASLYSHVRSKEEILQKICFRIAVNFLEGLQIVIDRNKSPIESLRDAIIMHCQVMTRDVSASAVFWNEWKHLSGKSSQEFQVMKDGYENAFINLIQKAMDTGKIRKSDARFVAMSVLSSLNCIHTWYKPEGKLSAEEVGEQLADMVLNGIIK